MLRGAELHGHKDEQKENESNGDSKGEENDSNEHKRNWLKKVNGHKYLGGAFD